MARDIAEPSTQPMRVGEPLLSIRGLVTEFATADGVVHAVDGVSYDVYPGETVGVVGESGSGKSVTVMSLLGLIPQPPGRIAGGEVLLEGRDLLQLDSKELRKVRGKEVAMIFQDPMTSLNPVLTVGEQIAEAITSHAQVAKDEVRRRCVALLELVGVPNPSDRFDQYPHEYSGGMRQRAMIAMAIANQPKILIADEPTTALDVTVEAQILNLMQDLQDEMGMAIIMITHDLGVIAGMADRVLVMYAGWGVERATTEQVFYTPKHPYATALLQSIPKIGVRKRLTSIPGSVPDLNNVEGGWCYFAPRCAEAMDICRQKEPPTFDDDEGHTVKCWLWDKQQTGIKAG